MNTDTARTEVLVELHAMLDCYPVDCHRNILRAVRYIKEGKMDKTLADAPASITTSELADLAIALARVR